MSNDKVLSDKDIDNIWRGVKSISSDDAKRTIRNAGIVRPITTSNGYFALLSLDIHNGERKEYHLSISNPFRIVKFEIAVAMTARSLAVHKIGKNKEAKLKYGKEVVEGDVNNGIEGRVKKKIQVEGVVERSHRVGENLFRCQDSRVCSLKRMESPIS